MEYLFLAYTILDDLLPFPRKKRKIDVAAKNGVYIRSHVIPLSAVSLANNLVTLSCAVSYVSEIDVHLV